MDHPSRPDLFIGHGQYLEGAPHSSAIRDLIPDATVERSAHKTAGAYTCAYEISVDN